MAKESASDIHSEELDKSLVAKESAFDLHLDDLYLKALFGDSEDDEVSFPISDEKYAEELQFQEAIMASLIDIQSSDTAFATVQESPPKQPKAAMEVEKEDVGESSQHYCEICVEWKEKMFKIESCSHFFCTDCICKHVAAKIQDNIHVVQCPGLDCRGVLKADACRPIMPEELISRWDEVLCESLVLASEKFYCPYKDCSAMLINDGNEVISSSECPICHRLFCARCYVPWHCGVECDEFQRLNEDEKGREDLLVRELAKERKWMRCPHCMFYVEKTEGCLHMTCRCGFQFCYACGETWSSTHGGCQRP